MPTMPAVRALPRPERTSRTVADVSFLFLGMPHSRLGTILRVARSIAHRASVIVRYHVIADQAAAPLQRVLRKQSSAPWYASSTLSVPKSAQRLHRMLTASCEGVRCKMFMWKPLALLLLPNWVPCVVVLDSDVFFFADIAILWRQFEILRARNQWMGFAPEQSPWNSEVFALGGVSLNGGVQLHRLQAMRQGKWTELLWRYATRDQTLPLNGKRGLGLLGDQTLYSWMTVNGTTTQRRVAQLSCVWNFQVGAWPEAVREGQRWATVCESGCNVLHGNGEHGKLIFSVLSKDPSGSLCAAGFASQRQSRRFREGSTSARLLSRSATICCSGRNHSRS